MDTFDALADTRGNALHGLVDGVERFGPRENREIGQIEINRKARKVADEKIDGGSAFECEARFLRDEWHGP